MKKIYLLFILCCSVFVVEAQLYNTAAGVRFSSFVSDSTGGNTLALTIQQRITPRFTIEAIGEMRNTQPVLTALLEYHKPILWRGLNVYAGVGGHTNLAKVEVRDFSYGLDFIIGAELQIPFLPLVVSADLKPAVLQTFNLGVKDVLELDWRTGISVRAIIFSDKQKRKRLRRKKKEIRQDKRENFFDDIKEKNPLKKNDKG